MRAGWWWIDRWRKSTAYTDMTLEEQGAYRNLLDELWLRDGVLPNDDRILAKVCGDATSWRRVRKVVLARFRETPDGLRNETHDEVMARSLVRALRQQRYRNKQRNVTPNVTDNPGVTVTGSPDPSPSPDPTTEKQRKAASGPLKDSRPPSKDYGNNVSKDWNVLAAALYLERYPEGSPPAPYFKILKSLMRRNTWEKVLTELTAYLDATHVTYHNWPKFAAGFGAWSTTALAARASPPRSGAMAVAKSETSEWLQDKLSREP